MIPYNPIQYIDDILDGIDHVETYIKNKTVTDFETDDLLFDAVMMRLQTIGESTSKISDELKQKYSDIPWNQIVGLRNYISHAYAYLDAQRVWLVIINDLPKLKVAMLDMRQHIST